MSQYQYFLWKQSLSVRERRLCHSTQQGPEQGDGRQHLEELKIANEGKIEARQQFGTLVDDINTRIDTSFTSGKDLPQNLRVPLKSNIALFMRAAIDQYSGQDRILQVHEFENYKKYIMEEIEKILKSIDNKDEEQKKQKEENEKKLKRVEEETSDLENAFQQINREEFDLNEANLTDPTQPNKIQDELTKYGNRKNKVAAFQGVLSEKFQNAQRVQQAFQKSRESVNNVNGWLFWIPLAGPVIAGVKHTVDYFKLQSQAAQANAAIGRFKTQFNTGRQNLRGVVADMQGDGLQIINAPEGIRSQLREKSAQEAEKLQKGESDTQGERAQALGRIVALNNARNNVRARREALDNQRRQLAEQRRTASVRVGTLGDGGTRVNEAIQKIEQSGALNLPGARGKTVQDRYQQLISVRNGIQQNVQGLQQGDHNINSVLSDSESDLRTLQHHELEMWDASNALRGCVDTMDQHLAELLREQELLNTTTTEALESVNKVQGSIAEGVSNVAIANIGSLTAIELQGATLEKLKVEAPSFLSHMVDLPLNAIKKPFEAVAFALEAPVLLLEAIAGKNVFTRILGAPNRILAGVVEGAGELIHGLGSLALKLPLAAIGDKEGLQMLAGLGKLIGRDPENGEWSWSNAGKGWLEMGKMLIAYDTFASGEWEKGIGKSALNIGMFFIPGVGQGVGAARGAAAAARLAGAGRLGVAVAAMKAFVAGTAGGTATSYARIPGNVWQGGRNAITRLRGGGVNGFNRVLGRPGRMDANGIISGRMNARAGQLAESASNIRFGESARGGRMHIKPEGLERIAGQGSGDFFNMVSQRAGGRPLTFWENFQAARAQTMARQSVALNGRAAAVAAGEPGVIGRTWGRITEGVGNKWGEYRNNVSIRSSALRAEGAWFPGMRAEAGTVLSGARNIFITKPLAIVRAAPGVVWSGLKLHGQITTWPIRAGWNWLKGSRAGQGARSFSRGRQAGEIQRLHGELRDLRARATAGDTNVQPRIDAIEKTLKTNREARRAARQAAPIQTPTQPGGAPANTPVQPNAPTNTVPSSPTNAPVAPGAPIQPGAPLGPSNAPLRVPTRRPLTRADITQLKAASDSGKLVTIRINGVDVPMKYLKADPASRRLIFERPGCSGGDLPSTVIYDPNRLRVIQRPRATPTHSPNVAGNAPRGRPIANADMARLEAAAESGRPVTIYINGVPVKMKVQIANEAAEGPGRLLSGSGESRRLVFQRLDTPNGAVFYDPNRLRVIDRTRTPTRSPNVAPEGAAPPVETPGGAAPSSTSPRAPVRRNNNARLVREQPAVTPAPASNPANQALGEQLAANRAGFSANTPGGVRRGTWRVRSFDSAQGTLTLEEVVPAGRNPRIAQNVPIAGRKIYIEGRNQPWYFEGYTSDGRVMVSRPVARRVNPSGVERRTVSPDGIRVGAEWPAARRAAESAARLNATPSTPEMLTANRLRTMRGRQVELYIEQNGSPVRVRAEIGAVDSTGRFVNLNYQLVDGSGAAGGGSHPIADLRPTNLA